MTWAMLTLPLMLLLFLLPILVVVAIARLLFRRQDSVPLSREEEVQLHQMMQSLERMEQRIANLEMILLERERPAPRKDPPVREEL